MYYSLLKHSDNFHLYIFAFDEQSRQILINENLKNVTVIGLNEFEDKELLAVKPQRTIAEYCWTCTSSTILFVLNKFDVPECTYIDADIFFYADPRPLFNELAGGSILLTEHRFSPIYHKDIVNGRFCVQFITFKNDSRGRAALTWWREQCIAWCYARNEDGKFGDQGYLNDWESRFEGVHVLQHLGGGVAPWNVQQYELFDDAGTLCGTYFQNDFEFIFYHFHYLKYFTNGNIELGRRHFTANDFRLLYVPYIKELSAIKTVLMLKYPDIDPHGTKKYIRNWKTPLIYVYRKLRGVYNIFKEEEFVRQYS
jgi:hypothetical protein